MNNRLALVDRELIAGLIEGVDFGPKLYCVARSPRAVLFWVYGHSYSVNGFVKYAEPSLQVIGDRSGASQVHRLYKRLHECGRLSHAVAVALRPKIAPYFDDEAAVAIADAVRQRKTLLIEGGGPPLMPARSLGAEAYARWRELPDRGFICRGGQR